MTTLAAIISGFFFFSSSAWIQFAVVLVFGLVQMFTKGQMNQQLKSNLNAGYSSEKSVEMISDRTTVINMAMTFGIWSLAIYAAIIKFT